MWAIFQCMHYQPQLPANMKKRKKSSKSEKKTHTFAIMQVKHLSHQSPQRMVTKGFLADTLSVFSSILHSHRSSQSHQWTPFLSLCLQLFSTMIVQIPLLDSNAYLSIFYQCNTMRGKAWSSVSSNYNYSPFCYNY